jgi:hypothetical protein
VPSPHRLRLPILCLASALTALTLACATTSAPAVPEEVELRYRWQTGQTLSRTVENGYDGALAMSMIAPTKTRKAVPMREEPVQFESRFDSRYEVESVDADGTARLRLIDEHPVSITVAADGEVLAIAGADEGVRAVLELTGDGALDPETVLAQAQNLFDRLPTGPVRVGDSWRVPQEFSIPELGILQGVADYTLRSIERGDRGETLAVVEVVAELELSAGGDASLLHLLEAQMEDTEVDTRMEIQIELLEGRMVFDLDRGQPVTSEIGLGLALTVGLASTAEGLEDQPRMEVSVILAGSTHTTYHLGDG